MSDLSAQSTVMLPSPVTAQRLEILRQGYCEIFVVSMAVLVFYALTCSRIPGKDFAGEDEVFADILLGIILTAVYFIPLRKLAHAPLSGFSLAMFQGLFIAFFRLMSVANVQGLPSVGTWIVLFAWPPRQEPFTTFEGLASSAVCRCTAARVS